MWFGLVARYGIEWSLIKQLPVKFTLNEEADALDILAPEVSDNMESCLRKLLSLP